MEELSLRPARQSAVPPGAGFLPAVLCPACAARWTLRLIRRMEWQAGRLARFAIRKGPID